MQSVDQQPVRWLWKHRIPLGKVSLLTGDPGLGKSFFTLDLAARVSRGLGVPPEPGLDQPASVLLLAADDDPADTLRPRLAAASADLDRIHFISPEPPKRKTAPALDAGLRRIAAAIRSVNNLRLIIVDPVTAWLHKTDHNSNRDVRTVIARLSRLARRHNAAILMVSHHRKDEAANSLHRNIGSLAFTAAVRTVFALRQDPAVADRRLLIPLKATLVADPTARAFTIDDGRLHWDPEPVVQRVPQDDRVSAVRHGLLIQTFFRGAIPGQPQSTQRHSRTVTWFHTTRFEQSARPCVRVERFLDDRARDSAR